MRPDRIEIDFDTELFDLEAEPLNDINPTHGHSFLAWLAPLLVAAGYEVEGPGTEDWGWYLEVRGPSGRYVVGASAMHWRERSSSWMTHLRRSRSLRERFRGEGRIDFSDPLFRCVEACVREHLGATEIIVELVDARGRRLAVPDPDEESTP